MSSRSTSVQRVLGALSVVWVLVASGCTAADEPEAPAPTPAVSGSSEPPAPASTPVPPPEPGEVSSTLKPRKVERRKPVALSKPGTAADGVVVRIKSIKAIEAKAVGPGEVTGPGLRVDVLIKNTTNDPVDLGAAVVSLTDQNKGPGAQMTGPPAAGMPVELKANSEVSAVYVFAVSKRLRNPVTIEVSLSGSVPTVVFRGKAA